MGVSLLLVVCEDATLSNHLDKTVLWKATSNIYLDHRIPSHRPHWFSVLLTKWLMVHVIIWNFCPCFFLGCCWICFLWINGLSSISVSAISLTLFAAFKVSFPQRRSVGQILVTKMNLVSNKLNVFSNKLIRFGFVKGWSLFKEKRPIKKNSTNIIIARYLKLMFSAVILYNKNF